LLASASPSCSRWPSCAPRCPTGWRGCRRGSPRLPGPLAARRDCHSGLAAESTISYGCRDTEGRSSDSCTALAWRRGACSQNYRATRPWPGAGVHVPRGVPAQGAAVRARLRRERAPVPARGGRGVHLAPLPGAPQAVLARHAHRAHPPHVLQQHGARRAGQAAAHAGPTCLWPLGDSCGGRAPAAAWNAPCSITMLAASVRCPERVN